MHFCLPIKTDGDELLNTSFAATLGYTFGIYKFDFVELKQPNIVFSNNYRRPPGKEQARSQLDIEDNLKRECKFASDISQRREFKMAFTTS